MLGLEGLEEVEGGECRARCNSSLINNVQRGASDYPCLRVGRTLTVLQTV